MAQWEERLGMQEGRMVILNLVSNCLQEASNLLIRYLLTSILPFLSFSHYQAGRVLSLATQGSSADIRKKLPAKHEYVAGSFASSRSG